MVIRITVMVLRICGVLALILGILFWIGIAQGLVAVHMLLGILVTLSLWVLGVSIVVLTRGNIGLGVGAIIMGILVVLLGLTQGGLLVGPLHWLVQVLHLLFGLGAIGLGEAVGGRYKRVQAVAVTQAAKS
jgi:hypothetical protein